jgi:predicted flap endonuclease-1-like 5' DNA nuclease
MKALCNDGLVIDCTDFKAIDTGVVLLGGDEKQGAVGFVPGERLDYVLPDDVVEREYDRLGVPAAEVASAEELESRLGTFVDELDALRESLDRQVEDLVEEGEPVTADDVERRDSLYERRREVDRALERVQKRAEQFQQLSLAAFSPADGESGGADADATAGAPSERDAEPLGGEMDERLATIERQLQSLAESVGAAASVESTAQRGEPEAEPADDPAEREIEGISGLGPTYRDRLESAGVETLGALAAADATVVAEAANVTDNKAQDWIDRADELLSERRTSA